MGECSVTGVLKPPAAHVPALFFKPNPLLTLARAKRRGPGGDAVKLLCDEDAVGASGAKGRV